MGSESNGQPRFSQRLVMMQCKIIKWNSSSRTNLLGGSSMQRSTNLLGGSAVQRSSEK